MPRDGVEDKTGGGGEERGQGSLEVIRGKVDVGYGTIGALQVLVDSTLEATKGGRGAM